MIFPQFCERDSVHYTLCMCSANTFAFKFLQINRYMKRSGTWNMFLFLVCWQEYHVLPCLPSNSVFRAVALNSKFLSQRARRSRSCLFARIQPPEKTFANFREKCFRAYGFGQKFSVKKVSDEIIRAKVFSGGWIRANGWDSKGLQ